MLVNNSGIILNLDNDMVTEKQMEEEQKFDESMIRNEWSCRNKAEV